MPFRPFSYAREAIPGYMDWDLRNDDMVQVWREPREAIPNSMPVSGSMIMGGPGQGYWTGVNPLTGQRERILMTPSGDLPGEQGWESENPDWDQYGAWPLAGGTADTG